MIYRTSNERRNSNFKNRYYYDDIYNPLPAWLLSTHKSVEFFDSLNNYIKKFFQKFIISIFQSGEVLLIADLDMVSVTTPSVFSNYQFPNYLMHNDFAHWLIGYICLKKLAFESITY